MPLASLLLQLLVLLLVLLLLPSLLCWMLLLLPSPHGCRRLRLYVNVAARACVFLSHHRHHCHDCASLSLSLVLPRFLAP